MLAGIWNLKVRMWEFEKSGIWKLKIMLAGRTLNILLAGMWYSKIRNMFFVSLICWPEFLIWKKGIWKLMIMLAGM